MRAGHHTGSHADDREHGAVTPEIAIVVSPRDWAESLHRFVADHGGARVRARILDSREALDERYQVLVAEDLTSFLTPRLVAELHRTGRRLLGVFDPTEPWGQERLRELGADDTVATTTDPEAMLRAVTALCIGSTSELDAELAALSSPTRSLTSEELPHEGPLTVVGGPAGGPGATEIAVVLAVDLASTVSTVLVDADDVAPSLAQRVGLPLHPNLRTAIDIVQHVSGDIEEVLADVGGARVLPGLSAAADAVDLRPAEVVDVLTDLARRYGHVVANVGHRLEEAAGRYGIARAVVAAADQIVAVAHPSPVGLARLLEWVADVRALSRAPIHVAFNRVPRGRFMRGELEEELRRTYAPPTVVFVPHDRRVEEAAWAGELVRPGPFIRAVRDLTAAVGAGLEPVAPA